MNKMKEEQNDKKTLTIPAEKWTAAYVCINMWPVSIRKDALLSSKLRINIKTRYQFSPITLVKIRQGHAIYWLVNGERTL